MKPSFKLLSLLLAGCLLLLSGVPVSANSLDSSGTGTIVSLGIRHLNLISAGGHPQFDFHATGTALVHHQNMPGWPEAVIYVTAYGDYNYNTGKAHERVYAAVLQGHESTAVVYDEPKVVDVELQCTENPWVHGTSSCDTTAVDDDIAAALGTTSHLIDPQYGYPLSAYFMDSNLRAALLDSEKTKLAGDPLQNWNPYAGNQGTDKMSISIPSHNAVLDENATTLQLSIVNNVDFLNTQSIQIEWERVEDVGGWIGDIKLPDGSKMFQPFAGPGSAPWITFPLTVSIGDWAAPGQPEYFRVRVRAPGVTGWTAWKNFWIGQSQMNTTSIQSMAKLAADTQKKVFSSAFKEVVEIVEQNKRKRVTRAITKKSVVKAKEKLSLSPKGISSETRQKIMQPTHLTEKTSSENGPNLNLNKKRASLGAGPDLQSQIAFERKMNCSGDHEFPCWIFDVHCKVGNGGQEPAGPSTAILERDIGPNNTFVRACPSCEFSVPALEPGVWLPVPVTFQFNNSGNTGYRFRLKVDSGQQVNEGLKEGNNAVVKMLMLPRKTHRNIAGKIPKRNLGPASLKAVVPTIMPMTRGASFPLDKVVVQVLHGTGQKPDFQFEQFDNNKWRKARNVRLVSMRPAGKKGSRDISKGAFRFNKAGTYRLRCKTPGSPWSGFQEIIVGVPRTAKANLKASGPVSAPKNGVGFRKATSPNPEKKRPGLKLTGVKKKLRMMPLAITFPTAGKIFVAPADITFKAGSARKQVVFFELKKGNGNFIKSDAVQEDLPAGRYMVRARYSGGNPGVPVSFTVKPPVRKLVKASPRLKLKLK